MNVLKNDMLVSFDKLFDGTLQLSNVNVMIMVLLKMMLWKFGKIFRLYVMNLLKF